MLLLLRSWHLFFSSSSFSHLLRTLVLFIFFLLLRGPLRRIDYTSVAIALHSFTGCFIVHQGLRLFFLAQVAFAANALHLDDVMTRERTFNESWHVRLALQTREFERLHRQ